jgi:hypothetical protein
MLAPRSSKPFVGFANPRITHPGCIALERASPLIDASAQLSIRVASYSDLRRGERSALITSSKLMIGTSIDNNRLAASSGVRLKRFFHVVIRGSWWMNMP